MTYGMRETEADGAEVCWVGRLERESPAAGLPYLSLAPHELPLYLFEGPATGVTDGCFSLG